MKVPYKKYLHGKEARDKLMAGVDVLADSVAVTLGGKGRNVVFESTVYQKPQVTNDGVTIAREGNLEDPFENMGMQLIKQASFRTNALAGDGTTSAIVVARELVRQAFAQDKGNPVLVRNELNRLSKNLIELVKAKRKEVKEEAELVNIATVSCQDAELGKLIGELVFSLGKDGAVNFEEGITNTVEVDKKRGFKWNQGIKEGLISKQRYEYSMGDARVLIINEDHISFNDFLPLAKQFVATDENGQVKDVKVGKLVIIAEKLHASIVQFLMRNSVINNGPLEWIWVLPPSFGQRRKEILEDLSVATGATVVDHSKGDYIKKFQLSDLGTIESVYSNADHTVMVNKAEKEAEVAERVELLEKRMKTTDSEQEQVELGERIAALKGGLATIKYGAATDVEKKELKYRLDDAVFAAKASMQEGYVEGGGMALLRAAHELSKVADSDENATIAQKILVAACQKPARQILENAGIDADKAIDKILSHGKGYNVKTNELVDMVAEGIIDPYKVVRLVVENAVSAAGTLITTDCAICNAPEEESKK